MVKKTLLLTNDDGWQSIGFYPLLRELSSSFEIIAVVPSKQRSWIGKSITAHEDISVHMEYLNRREIYVCSGTPADCIQIGLYDILDSKPALVVSGINIGVNIGHGRILSSGTVGAAMEASIDGVPAISSSLHIPARIRSTVNFMADTNISLFDNAARITAKFVALIMHAPTPKGIDLMTINIPFDATEKTSIAVTKPFVQPYGQLFHKKGNHYIHEEPAIDLADVGIPEKGSDLEALLQKKISVSPISLALASESSMQSLEHIISKKW